MSLNISREIQHVRYLHTGKLTVKQVTSNVKRYMQMFITQPLTIQLSHLQWFLLLLLLVGLILLVDISFSPVSGFSISLPILFLQFTSFSHIISKQDENAYIYIYIYIYSFSFSNSFSYLYLYSFHIHIHIHFIFPCIPYTIPHLHVTFTICCNALVI